MPITILDKANCTGCHSCASICPKQCISMIKDREGFLYPTIDETKCIQCNLCEKICPVINYNLPQDDECGAAFAALHKKDEIRSKSSSGGMFTAIAEKVIEVEGVVFGAAFDEDFNVKTICVETKAELGKLRGSKYVQSTIGKSYLQAKQYLEDGRLVLFSGTPCQIAGLQAYLNKKYDNLLTIDFICHGVPSPLVWQKYLEYQERTVQSNITKISFRNKSTGWKNYSVLIEFLNGTRYLTEFKNDPYMKIFIENYCLRPSCYHCAFKTKSRLSDITIADFWGIDHVLPDMDDDKGTSLIVVHSNKGKTFFDKTVYDIKMRESNIECCNYCYFYSVAKPKEREYFLKKLQKNDFSIAYDRLYQKVNKNKNSKSLKAKLIYKTKQYLRNILNMFEREK